MSVRSLLLVVFAVAACGNHESSPQGFRVGFGAGPGFTQSTGTGGTTITGGTCAAGQVVRSISSGGAVTCGVAANDYSSTHLEWTEEFMTSGTFAAVLGDQMALQVGNGGSANATGGTTTRPGLFNPATNAATNGRVGLFGGISNIDFASGSWTAEATFGEPTLSVVGDEYSLLFGFGDNVAGRPTDGCFFAYDRLPVMTAPGTGTITAGANKWQCWCCSNGTCTGDTMDGAIVSDGGFTTVNSPIAALTLPDTNMQRLKVVMTTNTKAEFFINDGGGFSKRCQITTNIPSGAARLTGMMWNVIKSAGTTSVVFWVDQMRYAVDLTVARSL